MVSYMSCDPEQAESNYRKMLAVFQAVEKDGVAQAELDQAKSKLRSRIVLSSERPRGRMFVVGSDWVYRRQYRPIEEDLTAVAAVTRESIAAVLEKHPLTRGATIAIGPLEAM